LPLVPARPNQARFVSRLYPLHPRLRRLIPRLLTKLVSKMLANAEALNNS